MAAIVLHVVYSRLLTVKYRMLSVIERAFGLMARSDVVFRATVGPRLCVMPASGLVMLSGDDMMRGPTQGPGGRKCGRFQFVR
jgi:hypothetical protein